MQNKKIDLLSLFMYTGGKSQAFINLPRWRFLQYCQHMIYRHLSTGAEWWEGNLNLYQQPKIQWLFLSFGGLAVYKDGSHWWIWTPRPLYNVLQTLLQKRKILQCLFGSKSMSIYLIYRLFLEIDCDFHSSRWGQQLAGMESTAPVICERAETIKKKYVQLL